MLDVNQSGLFWKLCTVGYPALYVYHLISVSEKKMRKKSKTELKQEDDRNKDDDEEEAEEEAGGR